MGYRTDICKPDPEKMLPRFDVRNGATMRLAFGCYYVESHDRKYHDHIGWPEPGRPDGICQLPPDFKWHIGKDEAAIFTPIDLIEEGYTNAFVTYEDETLAADLETSALIDTDESNIVRMSVKTDFDTFTSKPKEAHFTLFIENPETDVVDAVCHGIVVVLPGSPSRQGD